MRRLIAFSIILLWASMAWGYSGSGGVWAMKSGDFVATNFPGTEAGIQAAISYVGTVGGNVQISAGYYPITSALTISNPNVSVTGTGPSTYIYNNSANGISIFKVTGAKVSIRDLRMSGRRETSTDLGTDQDGNGVFVDVGGDDFTVSGCVIDSTTNDGVRMEGVSRGRILNCKIQSPGKVGTSTNGFGIFLNTCPSTLIEGNYIKDAKLGTIFVWWGSNGTRVIGNRCESGRDNGIRVIYADNVSIIGNVSTGMHVDGIRCSADSITIANNVSSGNENSGIRADSTTAALWSGNVCNNNGNNGLAVTFHAKGLSISGNSASQNGTYGVSLAGTVKDISILSNSLDLNNRGIDIKSDAITDSSIAIIGNHIRNSVGNGIYARCINAGAIRKISVIGNDVSGSGSGGIVFHPQESGTAGYISGAHADGNHSWANTTYGMVLNNATNACSLSVGINYYDGNGTASEYLSATNWVISPTTSPGLLAGEMWAADSMGVGVNYGGSGSGATALVSRGQLSGSGSLLLQRGTATDLKLLTSGGTETFQIRHDMIISDIADGSGIGKVMNAGLWRLGDTGTPTHTLEVSSSAQIVDSLRIGGTATGGLLKLGLLPFASLGTPDNRTVVYCTDCTKTTPCAGSGNGALAVRINGAWDCNP